MIAAFTHRSTHRYDLAHTSENSRLKNDNEKMKIQIKGAYAALTMEEV